PAAALADDAERLAAPDREGHPVHGGEPPPATPELAPQTDRFENDLTDLPIAGRAAASGGGVLDGGVPVGGAPVGGESSGGASAGGVSGGGVPGGAASDGGLDDGEFSGGGPSGDGEVGEIVLEAVGLRREFGRGRRRFTAVDGVSLTVRRGETLGVVGESGSGKTTLGRMLVGLLEPTAGSVRYEGRVRSGVRPAVQMVFQDPVSSLNPRRSVGESIADPLRARGERDETRIRGRVGELLERVGLEPAHYDRYPHEFSGGQRQRVGIARALAADPRVIVCDEPVSALDVTTQAQVVALLAELQRELGLALVFVAHDLAVVRQVSDRVAVMRRGRIVELGSADEVYESPRDPYTKQLLAAVPALDPEVAAERRRARRQPAAV
ncbi:ATP-binding cassette domain-containing protein, partial [Streptomyces sp. ME109]|uniref:ATP-binding cassette domain-containing protein n=1 Tax=Streptomyces sp. me109 TaxID=1827853 RepID=UPI0021C6BABD